MSFCLDFTLRSYDSKESKLSIHLNWLLELYAIDTAGDPSADHGDKWANTKMHQSLSPQIISLRHGLTSCLPFSSSVLLAETLRIRARRFGFVKDGADLNPNISPIFVLYVFTFLNSFPLPPSNSGCIEIVV